MTTPQYIFAFDTETTGLPDWKSPSGAEQQPHLVEIAARLYDLKSGKSVGEFNTMIRPDGWSIPDDVIAVHGITNEQALDEGTDEKSAVLDFLDLWKACDVRVAHNQSFDERILRIACKRFLNDDIADEWKAGTKACTAQLAKPIMQLPPKSRWGFKTPTLSESYQFFTGKALTGAHRAMVDADACLAIYLDILNRQTNLQPNVA